MVMIRGSFAQVFLMKENRIWRRYSEINTNIGAELPFLLGEEGLTCFQA